MEREAREANGGGKAERTRSALTKNTAPTEKDVI
jgi:hypothetical protein